MQLIIFMFLSSYSTPIDPNRELNSYTMNVCGSSHFPLIKLNASSYILFIGIS